MAVCKAYLDNCLDNADDDPELEPLGFYIIKRRA